METVKLARGALAGFVRAEMPRRGYELRDGVWVAPLTGMRVRAGRLKGWLGHFFIGRVDLAGARVKLEDELGAASRSR